MVEDLHPENSRTQKKKEEERKRKNKEKRKEKKNKRKETVMKPIDPIKRWAKQRVFNRRN